jgi:hypothetical protein
MTRREKGIIVIMAGVVIYGAMEGVIGGARKMAAESAAKSEASGDSFACRIAEATHGA